jgi:hypothetical protein
MNRLEIALELYKFGKADTIEECFRLADDFIEIDDENAKLLDKDYQDNKSNYPLVEEHLGHIDNIFKGQSYIEFEMPNSKARIYLLYDIKEAEKGFKTSDIKSSSEN